jgi:phage terminase small subunit
MNRKPIELHKIEGTKFGGKNKPTELPEEIKKRIPVADWMNGMAGWNKQKFILETSEYLWEVYGIGDDQNKHTLAMLADQLELYIFCADELKKVGLISNDFGKQVPNPLIAIRHKSSTLIIQLMNELGLTPRSRLAGTKTKETNQIDRLLRGPKAA